MPYERIDVRAATEALDAAAERLSAAKTLEEAEEAFSEREKIISHVQTMNTIAYIRHTVIEDWLFAILYTELPFPMSTLSTCWQKYCAKER